MGWVRALFDYAGGSETELSFNAGDVIETISDTPVDDWLEGLLNGTQGYFPFNYVEFIDAPAPEPAAAPPPVLPPKPSAPVESSSKKATVIFSFEAQGESEISLCDGDVVTIIGDDEGEGWCFVKSQNGKEGLFPASYLEISTSGGGGDMPSYISSPQVFEDQKEEPFVDVFADVDSRLSVMSLLGTSTEKYNVKSAVWAPVEEPYDIQLRDSEQKKKFGGLKHYTAYTIVTPSKDLSVSRRYKHFDWLRQQMVEKFALIAVPPLPSKQYSGRFQEDFITQRQRDLQNYLLRVRRHPVLRTSAVFMHFLMANNESNWKKGKRVAEKDAHKGSFFFRNVDCDTLPPKEADAEIAKFKAHLKIFDKELQKADRANEQLHVSCDAYCRDGQHYSNMFEVIAKGNETMGGVCWRDGCNICDDLSKANHTLADLVAEEFTDLKNAISLSRDELSHLFRDYMATIPTLQEILKVRESAMYTYMSAYSKSVKAGRAMTQDEERNLNNMKSRCDTITNIFLAEADFYHSCLIADFKQALRLYATKQAEYHHKIAGKWDSFVSQIDSSCMSESVPAVITQIAK